MCLCGGTCNCSFWVQDRNDGNATTDYVVGSLHEGFYERDDGGTHIIPQRMTRRWSGQMERMRLRVRIGIVTRLKREKFSVW